PMVEAFKEDEEFPKLLTLSKHSSSLTSSVDDNDEDDDVDNYDLEAVNHVINKPPEKRQRAPSSYNNFINSDVYIIREEIRRLKTQHPNMSHKQAFSTAAKNWAHSPLIQQNEDKSKGLGGD
ncbi:hypothetical protein M8C21_031208, partial [Ambrosia artemisiifolia]